MEYERRFKFLICAPSFNTADLDWGRLQEIVHETERLGFTVLVARNTEDAELAIQTDAAIGCMVVDWGKRGLLGKPAGLISLVRKRGLEMPVLLMLRRKRLEDIPIDVLNHTDGTIFLSEETPAFVALNLASRLRNYAATLKTPFFGALLDYSEQGNQLWTCPGHNGGIFYSRSPIGRIFVEHLGHAIFRDDIDNSVARDWATCSPMRARRSQAENGRRAHLRRRADVFRAQRHLVVQQDRARCVGGARETWCCSIATTTKPPITAPCCSAGGIPIYLPTDRNAYGMVGPIDYEALDETRIREAIRTNPLVTDPGRLAAPSARSGSP